MTELLIPRGTNAPTKVTYYKTRVTVVRGPDVGLTRELVSNVLRVGSSSDNDLVLRDTTVSRHHCSVEPVHGGIRVRDEGSTNGVLLAGLHVYDAIVTTTAHLQLGDTVIALEPLREAVDREQATTDRYGDLLGRSSRMRELFAELARVAAVDVAVLIEGETGTGKELVAESLHLNSPRVNGPFVVFDCSAVAAQLAESELFGHERGAFTGAVGARPGVFEQADGGTIFLDELGELPKELQPKLLRVLSKREVRRLGSQKVIPIDVRVIAATNRNLEAEVANGNFREDLFFRLAQTHVHVPPLRDRMDDLPLLVEHFLSTAKPSRALNEVPPPIWDMFMGHRWPGNVRELGNAVQRMIVTPDRALRPAVSQSSPPPAFGVDVATAAAVATGAPVVPLRIARRDAGDVFERQYLELILGRTSRNVSRAAAVAEVSRQMVQKLMRKHGIDR